MIIDVSLMLLWAIWGKAKNAQMTSPKSQTKTNGEHGETMNLGGKKFPLGLEHSSIKLANT
jgi:hypothetical protein